MIARLLAWWRWRREVRAAYIAQEQARSRWFRLHYQYRDISQIYMGRPEWSRKTDEAMKASREAHEELASRQEIYQRLINSGP